MMTPVGLAFLALVAGSAADATVAGATRAESVLLISPAECSPRTEAASGVALGRRAIVSDGGDAMVIACGTETTLLWRTGWTAPRRIEASSLFDAAQRAGIVPGHVVCSGTSLPDDAADCDIIDHSADWSVVVLETADLREHSVFRRGDPPLEFDVWSRVGGLTGNGSAGLAVWVVNGEHRPERLGQMQTRSGQVLAVAPLPNRRTLVSERDGTVWDIVPDRSTGGVMLSFSGAFYGVDEMTYARKFDSDGRQVWSITRPLPDEDGSPIRGDLAGLKGLWSGRLLALTITSRRDSSELLNGADGRTLLRLPGWPVAASRDAGMVLLRQENDGLLLMRIAPPAAVGSGQAPPPVRSFSAGG